MAFVCLVSTFAHCGGDMIKTMETLYRRDANGRVRVWFAEIDGGRYRTTSGLIDGEKVTSEWTVATAKNEGRSNETSPEQQALFEVQSMYADKLSKDYFETVPEHGEAKFFKPMLAASWDKRRDKIDFYSTRVYTNPKLDGIRCIFNRDGAWSRTGKPILAIDHIIEEFAPIFEEWPDAVFDGELYNHDLKEDFNTIVSVVRKTKVTEVDRQRARELIQYHVYDMPCFTESADDFITRYGNFTGLLMNHAPRYTHIVTATPCYSFDEIDEQYGRYLVEGYEGGIIRLNTPYEQKRSNNLIKRKDFIDEEFPIVRIEEGQGNWSGAAKTVVFRLPDGREVGAGLKGTKEFAVDVLRRAEDYIGKEVTIQYFTKTPDGIPRFPIAKALYDSPRI